jgi:hypothetical protein
MATAVAAKSLADELVSLCETDNPYEMSAAEMLDRQLAAVNERFQDRVGKIKLLQNRAEEGGISEVRSVEDIVPLLFAHTAYKSYPESWLMEEKWNRLGKWLDTVSTNRVPKLDTSGVKGLDEWISLLGEHGHFVSCSSGTTGKCAMMNATQADLDFCGQALLRQHYWAGLNPNQDRRIMSTGQVASTPRNTSTGRPFSEAIARTDVAPFFADAPPITIGGITEMVVLRKKMADGTITPSELEYYEATAKAREASVESVVEQAAQAIIDSRHMKLHITGMFGSQYRVAELVRSRGYSGKDFQENSSMFSGGLKRAQVPDNFLEIIMDTFNLTPERILNAYGMQECNTTAPMCPHGRFHVAPWVIPMILDESGEHLIEPPATGEIEGRAAFFDLSLDGRWGGVISGDKIRMQWEECACGNRSPSVANDIARYADMASGDKIACAGTIDAYVRGIT